MSKKIDLGKSVYELTREYPELIEILAGLGFTEVIKKPVLLSVGKIMTIPKGAKMKNISMMEIISKLISEGFEPAGKMPAMNADDNAPEEKSVIQESKNNRIEQIITYLRRLGDGEDLESVRADFADEFSEVEAEEIMEAEQQLINEGTPLSELQKLCDLHSALFHGTTCEEKAAAVGKADRESLIQNKVREEIARRDSYEKKDYTDKRAKADELEKIPGHPLYTLTKENEKLSALLEEYKTDCDESLLSRIRGLSVHYAKKGDLIYPLLKVKYGVSGPSDIMWTVDDEIRDELGTLENESERSEEWGRRVNAVLKRAEEMIYKEQNILFPICAVNFTEGEWYGIYKDSMDYEECLGVRKEVWKDVPHAQIHDVCASGNEIVMPGGHMNVEQLTALLNTIPMEITFVDAENINRFFNEGPKVFKRPGMAIDREVFSCHPPKIEPMVRQIIDDFRSNKRDQVQIWMDKNGRTMLVKYMAVRDKTGKYLGTAEFVQDMGFAREHFSGSNE